MKQFIRVAMSIVALVFSAVMAQADGQNIGACDPVQVVLGENGGNAFTAVAPSQIQLRHGAFVDAIILNGRRHGGTGGNATGVLQLRAEEYINRMVVRHGRFVDRIEITTNFGRSLSGGGNGGNVTALNNIRVLTLGGRSGQFLDQIQVTYCRNYRH